MPDKIDFWKMERLSPRADSWAKVCARLDAEAATAHKTIDIKNWYSAIPIAASLVLVSLTAILPAITDNVGSSEETSVETISINSSAPSEVLSWYSSLGSSASDEFETLEETIGFSYLIKE